MNHKTFFHLLAVLILMLILLNGVLPADPVQARGIQLQSGTSVLASLGTAFTYQGRLTGTSGNSVPGPCDMHFTLYGSASGSDQIGSPQTKSGVTLSNGFFTVELDFGASPFAGEERYLEVKVDCSDGSYTTLSPRAKLTAAPYALYALSAPWSGLTNIPAGFADNTDDEGVGDISAGVGLTRTVQSDVVTLSVLFAGSGSADDAAHSDHDHDSTYSQLGHTHSTTNQPPVAVLSPYPSAYLGESGTISATLSLALSYDPENGALTYAFDPTGWDFIGAPVSYSSNPTATVFYDSSGDYLASGWVRDNQNDYNRSQVLVKVRRFLPSNQSSSTGDSSPVSLAIVAKNPAMAFVHHLFLSSYSVMYVRASDADGLTWPTAVNVAQGNEPSLAEVAGYPALAYNNHSDYSLKYLRANNADGSSWGTAVTLETATGLTSFMPSLKLVASYPAIAYSYGALKYVRATNSLGSSWGTSVSVDTAGWHPSLAIVDGNPAIAYHDPNNFDLMYVRATDTAGSSWGTPVTVESAGSTGYAPSLAVIDGYPAIAYGASSVGGPLLKYVRANNSSGSAWGSAITVDGGGNAKLALIDGRPAIAYIKSPSLMFIHANDPTGATWNTPTTISSGASIFGGSISRCDMTLVGNRPAIGFNGGISLALSMGYKVCEE